MGKAEWLETASRGLVAGRERAVPVSRSGMSPNSAGVSAGIDDPHRRVTADATDVDTPYVDVGPVDAPAVVFPHGHPTWSYLWRNVIAPLAREFRCLAPDLPGMGRSAPSPDGRYQLLDHVCHLDACFTVVLPEGPLSSRTTGTWR